MFWPVDSPAKTSAKPESEPDCLAIARAFGLSSPVLLAKFDPVGWLPRTCQGSLLCLEQWEPLSGSWPDSAMWDQTSVYELQTSARPILENECSLWPTAVAKDDGKTPEGHLAMKKRMGERDGTNSNRTAITSLAVKVQALDNWPTARREDGESCGNHPGATDSLTGATRNWSTPAAHDGRRPGSDATSTQGANLKRDAEIWPTPQAHDQTGAREKNNFLSDHHYKPHDLVMATDQWQTPATDSFRSSGGDRKDEMGLDQQARFFPTPSASEVRQGYQRRPEGMASRQNQKSLTTICLDLSLQAPAIPDGPTFSAKDPTSRRRLNPQFVEWLMGLPPGWTEL